MAQDLGTGVSTVTDNQYYNYDMVVFQKGMPILDSEMNLLQQIQLDINQKQLSFLPSGWLSYYPFYTDKLLANSFYTQNPGLSRPEYALVNGMVVQVTNTGLNSADNVNIIKLNDPPLLGNRISGVFLEVWRALLAPNDSTHKPDPAQVIDTLYDVCMVSDVIGWAVGANGLIYKTENGGQTWVIQVVNTKHKLNGVSFPNASVGWAVGDNGTIVRTTNTGAIWNTLAVVTPENLTSVSSINQIMAWAVGNSGTVLKTINGVNWTLLSSGVTANLRKIHMNINGLSGWAVGENGTIIKTQSGGTSWRVVPSGTTANLNSVYFYDLNFGFAVGDGGTILRSSDGGESWVNQSNNILTNQSITENLYDVFMFPRMDLQVIGEEVTAQFDGTTRAFTTMNKPITEGDGRGTVTNSPSFITVTVDGTEATVESMNGASGTVTLVDAPAVGKTVKITYWYRNDTAVFSGWGWIVGQNGTILRSDGREGEGIGQNWVPQDSVTGADLHGVYFIKIKQGWAVGASSVIRTTINGDDPVASTWTEQQSDVVAREMQRVFKEGNVDTSVFLFDNSINPDAVVETTKRVQVQYKIRVQSDVDPESAPAAGLSGNVTGLGPNDTGAFGYENMGTLTGDYGLWRAQCLNTVDGYCYAIPMFFVAQRNSAAWSVTNNPNGSYNPPNAMRPDFLTSTMVVDSDIVDVRHKVILQGEGALIEGAYDALLNNGLRTRMARGDFGDVYGSELLQIDRVSGVSGGTQISNATLAGTAQGSTSSAAKFISGTYTDPAWGPSDTPRAEYVFGSGLSQSPPSSNGYYLDDPSYFSATYENGKPIPGYFVGLGTSSVKFVYGSGPNTPKTNDIIGTNYNFTYAWIDLSANGLTFVPAKPYLVWNQSPSLTAYYNGVMETDSSRVIDEWASTATLYRNYVLAYTYQGLGNFNQQHRASPVELHMFMPVQTSGLTLTFPTTLTDSSHAYNILSVSQVNNVTGGFSHKLSGQTLPDTSSTVTAVPGWDFQKDTVVEVVASVKTDDSLMVPTSIFSGSTVNINAEDKSIRDFCDSYKLSPISFTSNTIIINSADQILGISSMNTATSPTQYYCWVKPTSFSYQWSPCTTVTGLDSTQVTLTVPTITGNAIIQTYVKKFTLPYPDDSQDSLYISYGRNPQQAVAFSPNSITLTPVLLSPHITVSSAGTGGGSTSTSIPYQNPLEHIAVNDTAVVNDQVFNNLVPLKFPSITIDSGYAERPPVIPGSIEQSFTLSSPQQDGLRRWYYSKCSREFSFETEDLTVGVPRKIFTPMLCLVESCSDSRYVRGEYVMVIFSKNEHLFTNNNTGFKNGSNYAACVYRIPNRPLTRI